jgi:hypothetical protein
MRIGIVGGAKRTEPLFRRVAEERAHELEFHCGMTSSRSSSSLEALIRRCDVVVITTDINSHNAVRKARELAREQGRELLLCRRFGLNSLKSLLSGPTLPGQEPPPLAH